MNFTRTLLDEMKLDFSMILSCQRSVDDLNKALAQLLTELFVDQSFRLYLNVGNRLNYDFQLYTSSPENPSDIDVEIAFINAFDRYELASEDQYQNVYFPAILDDWFYACLVVNGKVHEDYERAVVHLLAIYCNVYNLISDSKLDGLTGLSNRKSFDKDLLQALQVSHLQRRQNDLVDETGHSVLAILDIDFFKKVNDTHGHLIGDEVLVSLAQHIRLSFREEDGLYRYGGEEFAVILTDTKLEVAELVLNRFCNHIKESHFPRVGNITISIGFCSLNGLTPNGAIDAADKALYHSKLSGRGRVTNFHKLGNLP